MWTNRQKTDKSRQCQHENKTVLEAVTIGNHLFSVLFLNAFKRPLINFKHINWIIEILCLRKALTLLKHGKLRHRLWEYIWISKEFLKSKRIPFMQSLLVYIISWVYLLSVRQCVKLYFQPSSPSSPSYPKLHRNTWQMQLLGESQGNRLMMNKSIIVLHMMQVWAIYDFQNVFGIQLLMLSTAGQCLYVYTKAYTYVETLNQTNLLIRLGLWSSRCSSCVMYWNLTEQKALKSDSLCLAA